MAQDRELDSLDVADPTERPIVAFDFDGTLTVRDSYTAFLKWRTPLGKLILGGFALIPAALGYLFDRDRGRIKAAATKVYLGGVPRERLEADGRRFAELHSRSLLLPDAVIAWKRWRKERASWVGVGPVATGDGVVLSLGGEL